MKKISLKNLVGNLLNNSQTKISFNKQNILAERKNGSVSII
jgi:hypothetical protein